MHLCTAVFLQQSINLQTYMQTLLSKHVKGIILSIIK